MPLPSPPAARQEADLVTVALKFLRQDGDPAPEPVRLDPASCPPCRQSDDPRIARENRHETIVALAVPRARFLSLEFRVKPGRFDRVILQTADLPLVVENDRLRLDLPPIERTAVEAAEFVTHVTGTGYVLRFEHGDPDRRFGAYAARFPAEQRAAADNLEFALRESVIALRLGEAAIDGQAGTIQIMGFDTNAPHGHLDAPPHVHMHLRWPYNSGTQIGHFYLRPDGRMDRIVVGASFLNLPSRTYRPGETFDTASPQRRVFFRQTVTVDGGLVVANAEGASCRIGDPQDDFRRAVHVSCSGRAPVVVAASDDLAHGVLTVRTGALREVFRYDRRTGLLLSPAMQPASEPSDVAPTFRLDQPQP